MSAITVKPLDTDTWLDFAHLVEKHNGVWGGSWCMSFHPEGVGRHKTVAQNRSEKECRVREGHAHAALVFDGSLAVGWCQFGPTDELPRIKHRRQYEEGAVERPEWRITCFFVDRDYRRKGVASAALAGALEEIARLAGGLVESYPQDAQGLSVSDSFSTTGRLRCLSVTAFKRHEGSARTIGW